ncbi:hypothetical protein KRR26_09695 [Corallococcus sp. M34]|uniref:hypothetical protein n=1 Tax=Citreicoccus inhibens TaxID=2849499 RepID=UPI001C22C34B|nr:hypothetical protein [Citreicoccus inhibens]MBU8895878.1 hypothetical protein [Citreicoccus inhibens]
MASGTDVLAPLETWGTWSVSEVLEALAALAERRRAGLPVRLPYVTLHLRSGRDAEGFVRDLVETRHGHTIVMHVPGHDARLPRADATFIPAAAVESLSVHEVSVLDMVDAETPAPTPLAVKRILAALSERLGRVLGSPLRVEWEPSTEPEDPSDAHALAYLAERSTEVLDTLAMSADSRDALRAKVHQVRLRVARDSAVALTDGTLMLTTGHRPRDWFTRAELSRAVAALL